MPKGVYERKPWMKTYSKTLHRKEALVAVVAAGYSIHQAAKYLSINYTTAKKLMSGNWNKGRRMATKVATVGGA